MGYRTERRTRALKLALILIARRAVKEIMAGQGRWVSRKDVKYLVDPGQKKLQVVSYEKWGDRTNELVQTYNKLIKRDGH